VEAFEDASLESLLSLAVEAAQFAAVFEWMGEVDEIGLCCVVEEPPESIGGASGSLQHEIGNKRGVLCDGVEDAAVPAEATLVRERVGDVGDLDLLEVGVERVDATATDGLNEPAFRPSTGPVGVMVPSASRCGSRSP
jgi:hypothetical protein